MWRVLVKALTLYLKYQKSQVELVLEKVPRRDASRVELRLFRLLSEIRAALHTERPLPFYRVQTALLCNRCNRTCYVWLLSKWQEAEGN